MIMLRAIYARSEDGWAAKGPDDDMEWTGRTDKMLFRALTSVGGVIGVGSTTYNLLPGLSGRKTVRITRSSSKANPGMSLMQFASMHPGAWLAGGPTVLNAAFNMGIIGEVHECVVQKKLKTLDSERPIKAPVIPDYFSQVMRTTWRGDLVHFVHRVL